MNIDACVSLAASIVAAGAAAPLSRRLPPRAATWTITIAGVVLATTGMATLALLATGGVLESPRVAALAHVSVRFLRRMQPPESVAEAAGAVLVASVCGAVYVLVRQVLALRAAARTADELPGSGLVSLIEDDETIDAFALPGRPGRIVVSAGMLAVLEQREREALIAHERAHLDCRHHLFRAAVRVASAANPLLWPLRPAVVFASERWADERAASTVGDRHCVAHAIAKAAIAGRFDRAYPAALGFGSWGRKRPGPVPRRVQALLKPPPHRRRPEIALAVAGLLLTVAAVQEQAADLHELVDIAQTDSRQIQAAGHHPVTRVPSGQVLTTDVR
ncbi:M56 family metallopeptidase [Nonomuraea sediminis]|uniref:M56 family metallopeptidase n=1 Tax=Nonomuraea sediminis TaxID=2835864 RepID=UPI001BDDA323|nr:M56 family metallopeptidase [Nonomuraea sediminis]